MEAVLEFLGFKVESVDYNLIDFENFKVDGNQEVLNKLENNQVNVDISANVYDIHSAETSKIQLNINTTDKIHEEVRRVNFAIVGVFKINSSDVKDEEREDLLKINGTAILLPYCRNYLSNLTGFDTTYSQLLMPPFNVTTLFNDGDNQN